MAKTIPHPQSFPIYSDNKNILTIRDFKVYPGMYYHKITIQGSGTITHKKYKLSEEEIIAIDNANNTNGGYASISNLPTYQSLDNVSDETLSGVINTHNSNSEITSVIFDINRCQIKTNARVT